jgi:hypothetical protein
MNMSRLIQNRISLVIISIAILVMLAEYILAPFQGIATSMRDTAVVVAGFAIAFGAVTLTIYHGRIIGRRQSGYLYSISCLGALFVMLVFGLLPPIGGSAQLLWIYTWVNSVAERTVYGSLAFWIFAAAYRAFRVKSLEATILLITALVVCFANTPISAMADPIRDIQLWILSVPTVGAYRAITISVACGLVALGVRNLIGRGIRWE